MPAIIIGTTARLIFPLSHSLTDRAGLAFGHIIVKATSGKYATMAFFSFGDLLTEYLV